MVKDSQVLTQKVVIDPTEWSHNKPSEASDIDSHRSYKSSEMNPIPADLGFMRKEENSVDKRPFKPFANFNKPVTLYEMSRVAVQPKKI